MKALRKFSQLLLLQIIYYLFFSYTVMTSYNYTNGYSLLSYLEYPIILVQEYILIFFVLKYLSRINMWSFLYAMIYFALSSCLLLGIVPKVILTLLAVGSAEYCKFFHCFETFFMWFTWIFSQCVRRSQLPVKSSNY